MPWKRKELLSWNKKYFSSSLKGFHWSKENISFEGEGPTLIWEDIKNWLAVNNFFKFKGVLNRAFTAQSAKSNIFILSEEKRFVGEKWRNIG